MNNANVNPCPLERPVGRRSGKEWLLAFALSIRSWLLNIPAQYAEYRYCALECAL